MDISDFSKLTQKEMVKTLRAYDAEHGTVWAKGKSKTRKEALINTFKALQALEPEEVKTTGAETGRFDSSKPNESAAPKANLGFKVTDRRGEEDPEEDEITEPDIQLVDDVIGLVGTEIVKKETSKHYKVRVHKGVYFVCMRGEQATTDDFQLSSSEQWLLERFNSLRAAMNNGGVQKNPLTGERSNPTRRAQQELRRCLKKLKYRGITILSDEALQKLVEQKEQIQEKEHREHAHHSERFA